MSLDGEIAHRTDQISVWIEGVGANTETIWEPAVNCTFPDRGAQTGITVGLSSTDDLETLRSDFLADGGEIVAEDATSLVGTESGGQHSFKRFETGRILTSATTHCYD